MPPRPPQQPSRLAEELGHQRAADRQPLASAWPWPRWVEVIQSVGPQMRADADGGRLLADVEMQEARRLALAAGDLRRRSRSAGAAPSSRRAGAASSRSGRFGRPAALAAALLPASHARLRSCAPPRPAARRAPAGAQPEPRPVERRDAAVGHPRQVVDDLAVPAGEIGAHRLLIVDVRQRRRQRAARGVDDRAGAVVQRHRQLARLGHVGDLARLADARRTRRGRS